MIWPQPFTEIWTRWHAEKAARGAHANSIAEQARVFEEARFALFEETADKIVAELRDTGQCIYIVREGGIERVVPHDVFIGPSSEPLCPPPTSLT
jgi:hypothetical protein